MLYSCHNAVTTSKYKFTYHSVNLQKNISIHSLIFCLLMVMFTVYTMILISVYICANIGYGIFSS